MIDPEKEIRIRVNGYSQELLTAFVNDLDEFLKEKHGFGVENYTSTLRQAGDLIQQDFTINYKKETVG